MKGSGSASGKGDISQRWRWSDAFSRSSMAPVVFNVKRPFREAVRDAVEHAGLISIDWVRIEGSPASSGTFAGHATAVLDGMLLELTDRWGLPMQGDLNIGMWIIGTRPLRLACLLLGLKGPSRPLLGETYVPASQDLLSDLAEQTTLPEGVLRKRGESGGAVIRVSSMQELVIELYGREAVPRPVEELEGVFSKARAAGGLRVEQAMTEPLHTDATDASADTAAPVADVGLSVCTTCFGLRGEEQGKEHRCSCQVRDQEWMETVWAGYDIPSLLEMCNLCVRATRRSGTRWSWYACETCRSVNLAIGEALVGPRVQAIPFGRHSLMNQATVRARAEPDWPPPEDFPARMIGMLKVSRRLDEWKLAEGRRHADSIGLRDGSEVPLQEWLELFPACMGASVDAFCRFAEVELPSDPALNPLRNAHKAFKG